MVSQVVKDDPGYILWAIDNITDYLFDVSVISIARDSLIPAFDIRVADLEQAERLLIGLEKGLDPYGTNGSRQLHGFQDTDDIHKRLHYVKRLISYLRDELSSKRSLYIRL